MAKLGSFEGVPPIAIARLKATKMWPYFATQFRAFTPIKVEKMFKEHGVFLGCDKHFRLYYDPEKILEFEVEEIATGLAHECYHCINNHQDRAQAYCSAHALDLNASSGIINACQDAEINDGLVKEPGAKFPPGYCVLPKILPAPCADGDIFENYLDKQKDKLGVCKIPSFGGNCGSAAHGQKQPWELDKDDPQNPGISKAEQEIIARQVAKDVQEYVKQRGTVPAGLERWAKEKLEIKFDPRRELAASIRYAVMEESGANNFSWRRFARRAPKNIFLPGLSSPVPTIDVLVDTSGSMTSKALAGALELIHKTLTSLGQKSGIRVTSVDAAVHTCNKVFSKTAVRLGGGGGTDMRVGLEHIVKLRPRPDIIICVTDGATPWPSEPLPMKLIVALIETDQSVVDMCPSWAKVIHLDETTN